MTTNITGNPLWKRDKTYACGCKIVEGQKICPRHGKPILEMIYGNDDMSTLNEKKRYEQQTLNE